MYSGCLACTEGSVTGTRIWDDLLRSYSRFRDHVQDFLSQKEHKVVECDGCIFVSQNEFAVTRNSTYEKAQDSGDTSALRSLINKIGSSSLTIDIVGGFLDTRDTSKQILCTILNGLIQFPESFHLRTPCFARALRHVRLSFSKGKKGGIVDIFDDEEGLLRLDPFHYEPLSDYYIKKKHLLSMPPQYLIKHISTSPEVEKDNFLPNFIECIQFMKRHPDSKAVFPNGKPCCFKYDTSSRSWKKKEEDTERK
ncbi:NTAN1 [Lepeophtheirus salmonis]|uniref:NTAN1 n=1 Tax=Lepeophtheirus salmonis TaxID=72036 RepID=A0A7R8CWQ1_LEPSM|nr:NTAN1 [Lepeophtheirus salmonis]CAF2905544.1 NTAN1 [Lepeophtheirus salmonis]